MLKISSRRHGKQQDEPQFILGHDMIVCMSNGEKLHMQPTEINIDSTCGGDWNSKYEITFTVQGDTSEIIKYLQ